MWAVVPRRQLQARACRHFAGLSSVRSAAPAAASESTFGLLQALKGEEASSDVDGVPSGRVLSASGGLARVAMTGPVSVGSSVDFGNGSRGMVVQFDRKGAIVAPFSRQQPASNALAVMGGPLAVQAPSSSSDGVTFASVAEVLSCQDQPTSSAVAHLSRDLLRLPSMPMPSRRRPVSRRLPSGLAAAEALLPLGEGQRIGFVGPAGTGKSKAVQMLLASQPPDTVCIYAAQQPLAQLEKKFQGLGEARLTVLHADPVHDSAMSRYLLPICALQLATQLRSTHRHVLLILDDLVAFASATAELQLGRGGTFLPMSVSSVVGAALDGAGVTVDEGGRESSFSVVAVVDIEPNTDGMPSVMRDLWHSTEQSLDISLHFTASVATNGIMPAIDPKELLSCGSTPVFQVPLLKLLRAELSTTLKDGYDLAYRMKMRKDLGLQMEDDESDDLTSSTTARALLAHSEPRPLPELAVMLCAALVYQLPQRRPSPVGVARFQAAVVNTVRSKYPELWAMLENMEALNEAEAVGVIRNLGEALIAHRFDFQLTRPEL